jgi:GT2 family glycosyltransferase
MLPAHVWITVVDNAAQIEPVRDLVDLRPLSRYLATAENVGFAAGANHGAASTSAEIIIFVNPATFPDPRVLEALVAELANDPACASCSPATVHEEGSFQYGGGGWLPTIRRATVHALGLHRLLSRSGIVVSPRVRTPLDLEWLAGTCVAIRRSVFEAVGGFDDRFFLYNEDLGLGRRLHMAGFRQRLRADLLVPHIGGASSRSTKPLVWRLRAESMVAYLQAYHPRSQELAIRGALAGGYLLRAAVYGMSWRWERAKEMWAYLTITAGGHTGRDSRRSTSSG